MEGRAPRSGGQDQRLYSLCFVLTTYSSNAEEPRSQANERGKGFIRFLDEHYPLGNLSTALRDAQDERKRPVQAERSRTRLATESKHTGMDKHHRESVLACELGA